MSIDKKNNLLESTFGAYAGVVKIVLVILGVGLITLIIWLIYKQIEKARIQKLLEGTNAVANVNGSAVTVNIGTKASEIYDALHSSWWSEDEVKAVNAVLSVPKPLIPQLSSTYYSISGNLNLKQDLQSYLSSEQWSSISSQFD